MPTPFVPFVPIANHIVNKTVVYCDTVIPIQNMGSNIKVFTLENINSYDYKDCINKICETNPNVLFHTIQYSAEKKAVTFYTDVVLDLTEYNKWISKKNETVYSVPGNNKLVAVCEQILNSSINPEISLFDYYVAIKGYHDKAKRNINRLREIISDKFNYYDESKDCQVKYEDDIEYKLSTNELIIKVSYEYDGGDKCILTIKKTEDGKLYLAKASKQSIFCVPANDLFNHAFNYIFELYEFLHDYAVFRTLIPSHISLNNGLCVKTHYTADYCFVTLSEETFFPKKYLEAKDNTIKIVGLDYYSLQKINDRQYELFKKIEIAKEDIKNISFLFPEKKKVDLNNKSNKFSIWAKIKNFF